MRSLWTLVLILWNKYIMHRKPAEAIVGNGMPLSQALIKNYNSMAKLVAAHLVEVDIERPFVYISRTAYDAFMMPNTRTTEQALHDDARAVAFMANVRFYVNFQRNYIRGLMESRDDQEMNKETTDKLTTLAEDEWLPFMVAADDEGSEIYKVGKYKQGQLEMHVYEPDKYPTEALAERMKILKVKVERLEN